MLCPNHWGITCVYLHHQSSVTVTPYREIAHCGLTELHISLVFAKNLWNCFYKWAVKLTLFKCFNVEVVSVARDWKPIWNHLGIKKDLLAHGTCGQVNSQAPPERPVRCLWYQEQVPPGTQAPPARSAPPFRSLCADFTLSSTPPSFLQMIVGSFYTSHQKWTWAPSSEILRRDWVELNSVVQQINQENWSLENMAAHYRNTWLAWGLRRKQFSERLMLSRENNRCLQQWHRAS